MTSVTRVRRRRGPAGVRAPASVAIGMPDGDAPKNACHSDHRLYLPLVRGSES